MKSKGLRWAVGLLGLFFILSSLIITLVEYQRFMDNPVVFPSGSLIAGLPVAGLEKDVATARISEYYSLPLLIYIGDATIHASPQELGFSVDAASLVEAAAQKIHNAGFWSHLWGQSANRPVEQPLSSNFDEGQTIKYLEAQIIPRYLRPGRPITPILGTTNFEMGELGEALALDQAVRDIQDALVSPTINSVSLEISEKPIAQPDLAMLQTFLKHNIDWIGFDDLVEIYLEPLGNGQALHFALQGDVKVEPDVAFTAASTIKIPIMISVLRRTAEPTPEEAIELLERMILFSENPPADTLMATYLDETRGPLIVSEDLAELGMQNTFLAGYFYLGAPVLQIFETPANSRRDIFLDPDIYNQTVPAEAGQLLSAIYTCATDGSGLLSRTFPDEMTQGECQLMLDILSNNRIGLLIEAGLPPEATIAHKHGWVQELDGLLHSMSDVAIVSTPAGDYVLNIFIYDPDRLDFDQGNRLFARLSQTVYNFFNLENQTYWWFE